MTKEQEMARVYLLELDRLYFDEGAISREEYLKEVEKIEKEYKVKL
jgi:hypothetical protein